MRKKDPKNINLKINRIVPFKRTEIIKTDNGTEIPPYVGFIICWSSDIGFGEYTIKRPALEYDKDFYNDCDAEEEWIADSEHTDINEDKEFIKELMRLFIEKLEIKE